MAVSTWPGIGLLKTWRAMISAVTISMRINTIASLAILGLYLGSALFRRRADRLAAPGRSLLRALVLLAATALLGLLLLARLPELLMFPFQEASGNAFVRILLLPLVVLGINGYKLWKDKTLWRSLGAAVVDVRAALAGRPPPPGLTVELGGQNREMQVSFDSLRFAILLAVSGPPSFVRSPVKATRWRAGRCAARRPAAR